MFSGETITVKEDVSLPTQRICTRCKFVSSQEVCKACVLLEGLNKGLPKLGIGKSSKAKKMLEEYNSKNKENFKNTLDDLNDAYKNNNCVSKGKVCKSGCKSKEESNSESNFTSKQKCCNGNCHNTVDKTNETYIKESKVNSIINEYGLNDTPDTGQELNGEKCNSYISEFNENEELIDQVLNNEEETCAGACGKMDSLHIAF